MFFVSVFAVLFVVVVVDVSVSLLSSILCVLTVIMTDETSRMKDKMKKLENDNIKLIELVKQRDAKMFEMKNEVGARRRLIGYMGRCA